MKFRKLNDEGVRRFAEYLRDGAIDAPPLALLNNPETSGPLAHNIILGTAIFKDRYEFGVYLNTLLKDFDPNTISNDGHFWTSLALAWFDKLCESDATGKRKVMQQQRYILGSDYRNYYRHLVRSPWQLVRQHGSNSRFLLIAPRESNNPLSVNGEIFENFSGRQQVLASKPLIAAANKMYFDVKTGRPHKGASGKDAPGTSRRLGSVLRQLALTYDAECMSETDFINILPKEFDKWKPDEIKQKAA